MDKDQYNLLRRTLKRGGFSLTAPRRQVFEALANDGPLSMAELQKQLTGQVDRASLYRIVKAFEATGIVQRVNFGWKYKLELTDLFSLHHHHLSCLGCGQVIAASEDPTTERLIRSIARRYKIKPLRHQLEIQGLCPNCLEQKGVPR